MQNGQPLKTNAVPMELQVEKKAVTAPGRSAKAVRSRELVTVNMKIVTPENILVITNALLRNLGRGSFQARLLPGEEATRTLRITGNAHSVKRIKKAVREAAASVLLLLVLPLLSAAGDISLGTIAVMWSGLLLVILVFFFLRAYMRSREFEKRNRKYFQP